MSEELPTYEYTIDVQHLNFDYGGPLILNDINLSLKAGSRCILVGANGAGKTSLLRILGGKRMISGTHINILGKNVFKDAPKGVTYLGTEWANNPVVRSDLSVGYLLYSMGSTRWPERARRLLEVLDVDTNWHMHQISDGQRRRVQLVMGLLHPWNVLLIDEVTVDLDVLARSDFLAFLKEETETRGATIVYATHIFDGLGQWPTHIAHMSEGRITEMHAMDDHFVALERVKKDNQQRHSLDSPLMELCYEWLRQDRARIRMSGDKKPIDPETGLPHSKWDELGANMKDYGDKYYNYWK
ncbi:P-loop containing nucleoside triphosphate hydrolase protein [Halteromyces radiatus]|uniref:P-loop containing nucleoside triphosphate hydrolase protein n=1 Tax=Halteromyces radiatus TaxID=101107 RepID=UPI0022212281|nr:P-loop containing nucleoside triphosphate hydrolase protein [Halteromyces radiatus]KAI8084939.1 P-loop containing nucleoside triphosphate hydrolase protein [Halteromyces radiatus]